MKGKVILNPSSPPKICHGFISLSISCKGEFQWFQISHRSLKEDLWLKQEFFFHGASFQGIKFFKKINSVLTEIQNLIQQFNKNSKCILLYQNESSAVTCLGSKLLQGNLQKVYGWESNSVTYQSSSEPLYSCCLKSFKTDIFSHSVSSCYYIEDSNLNKKGQGFIHMFSTL